MNLFLNEYQLYITEIIIGSELKLWVNMQKAMDAEDYYLVWNGKLVNDQTLIENGTVHIVLRIVGGKGGFGSMLRAIGAQIEKTTNREACRDLSGRRLRDINEEKRLKNWINQQAEREKEAKVRKQKKLERLCEKPKHEFHDEQYDKARGALPEVVENAVTQGLQASCSTKRKAVDTKEVTKKKKVKLWVDDDLDSEISSDGDDEKSDCEENGAKPQETSSTKHEKYQQEDIKKMSLEAESEAVSDTFKSSESPEIQDTNLAKETECQQDASREMGSEISSKTDAEAQKLQISKEQS